MGTREEPLNAKEGDVGHEGKKENDKQDLSTLEKGKGRGFHEVYRSWRKPCVHHREQNRQRLRIAGLMLMKTTNQRSFLNPIWRRCSVVDDSHGATHVMLDAGF